MKTAKHICELRDKMEMSQSKFGKLVGVSAMRISRWERGSPVSSDALVRMALVAHAAGLNPWPFLEAVGLTRDDARKMLS